MNVSIEKQDNLSAVISIEVSKCDYEQGVDKLLKDYRKRVDMPGFRKGKVPMGLIVKKYGIGAKVDEINKIISDKLIKCLEENKIDILGDPLPSESTPEYDFATTDDFKFDFDVALKPKIEVTIDKNDHLTYYNIEPTTKMIDEQIDSLRDSYGSVELVDTIEEMDVVKGLLVELDGDRPKDGGIVIEGATLMPKYLHTEEDKIEFIGKSKNTVVTFVPYTAMAGNPSELQSFLGIEKDKVEDYKETQFSFEVQEIKRRFKAELNEDFYRQAFGEQTTIKTEEDLRENIKQEFSRLFQDSSNAKFIEDINHLLKEKIGEITYADDILRRWLIGKNKLETEAQKEEFNKDYPRMIEHLSLQLSRNYLLETNNVEKVTEDEIKSVAISHIHRQLAQYGMYSLPENMVDKYLENFLKDSQNYNRMSEAAADIKLLNLVKQIATIEEKTVDADEFSKMMEENKQ